MRMYVVSIGTWLVSCALVSCGTSPTAPSSSAQPSAGSVAGQYTLTLQIDEGCIEFPGALRTWSYEAILEDHGYISIRVLGRAFTEPTVVGQLYMQDDSRFRFVLNFDYEMLDRYPESQELLLYGGGDATGTRWSISGTVLGTASLTGRAGVRCAGSHRLTFDRQSELAG